MKKTRLLQKIQLLIRGRNRNRNGVKNNGKPILYESHVIPEMPPNIEEFVTFGIPPKSRKKRKCI